MRVLLLLEDSVIDEPFGGWILDSSPGGVRLAVRDDEIPEGTELQIRSPSASRGMPWVTVRVKHRRRGDGEWELGCEFVRPSLNDPTPFPS
jgi:hypothetical protein